MKRQYLRAEPYMSFRNIFIFMFLSWFQASREYTKKFQCFNKSTLSFAQYLLEEMFPKTEYP